MWEKGNYTLDLIVVLYEPAWVVPRQVGNVKIIARGGGGGGGVGCI